MRTLFGEEKEIALGSAMKDYDAEYDYLDDKAKNKQVLSEAELQEHSPFTGSPNTKAIYDAEGWIAKADNQSKANKEWHAVLDATLHAISIQLRNFTLALSNLDVEVRSANYAEFKGVVNNHLTALKGLETVLRGKSLLWTYDISGLGASHNRPYVCRQEQTAWTYLGGSGLNNLAVTRPFGSDRSVLFGQEPGERTNRMYAMSVGLDFDNDGGWKGPIPEMIGARDVHALPGNKPGEVWVYWTGPGFTAIGTYSPSEPNKFTLVQKFERTGGMGIRAVPGQGMECCYVLENKDGFSIWKVNSHRNFVPFWWRESVRGIAACQTFLWVFRDREIAYLTHEDTTVIGDNMPWGVVRLFPVRMGCRQRWMTPNKISSSGSARATTGNSSQSSTRPPTPRRGRETPTASSSSVIGSRWRTPLTPGQRRYIGSFSRRGRNTWRRRLLYSRSSTPRSSRRRDASHKTES